MRRQLLGLHPTLPLTAVIASALSRDGEPAQPTSAPARRADPARPS